MINQIKINEQIKYFRKRRGLTQEELAEILDVSIGAVSKWESGQNTPELNMIVNLAKLFEVSVDVLIGYEVESLDLEENLETLDNLVDERKIDDAIELSKRLLFKYPNNFKVVYKSAQTYFLAPLYIQDKKQKKQYFEEAIKLERKSLQLVDQDKTPLITEIKIKSKIAKIYKFLENTDEAVKILEDINVDNLYSSEIGYILSTKSKPSEEDLEKAYENLQIGLMNSIEIIFNTCYGYINYYIKNKVVEYNKILDICNVAKSYCDSLSPSDKNTSNYLDRMKVTFLLVEAIAYKNLGDENLEENKLIEIKTISERYDKNPSFKIETVHLSKEFKYQTHDDIGQSLMESISRLLLDIIEEYDEIEHIREILQKWEKIRSSK